MLPASSSVVRSSPAFAIAAHARTLRQARVAFSAAPSLSRILRFALYLPCGLPWGAVRILNRAVCPCRQPANRSAATKCHTPSLWRAACPSAVSAPPRGIKVPLAIAKPSQIIESLPPARGVWQTLWKHQGSVHERQQHIEPQQGCGVLLAWRICPQPNQLFNRTSSSFAGSRLLTPALGPSRVTPWLMQDQ
jgi:hypothetical protein